MMEQYLNRDLIINDFYNDFIGEYIDIPEDEDDKYAWLCGWSNKHNQYERFKNLLDIGVQNDDKILDIGCGVGELINYLKEINLDVEYMGVDINPIYLQLATSRFPKHRFASISGWEFTGNDFDWGIASGIFTIETNITYVLWYVGYIMSFLNKGFAFNLLDENATDGLVNYNPEEIYDQLIDRFPEYNVEIVKGYVSDDFTIYIKK